MEPNQFRDISNRCLELVKQANIQIIQKLYSNFVFSILSFQNNAEIKQILTTTLKQFKFITYKISQIPESIQISQINIKNNTNFTEKYDDVIICAEKNIYFIEQVDINILNDIFENNKSLINIIHVNLDDNIDESIATEIQNFCKSKYVRIKNSDFIKLTIEPVLTYSIRKFFMPTNSFKDPSFFTFGKQKTNDIDINNPIIQEKLKKIFLTTSNEQMIVEVNKILEKFKNQVNDESPCKDIITISDENVKLIDVINAINEEEFIPKDDNINAINEIYDFEENDFIILRNIYFTKSEKYCLAMHVDSLHIFMFKQINSLNQKYHQREIEFCQKYSHRCFTRFYGFVKEKDEIQGFIYEFMSNGTLSSYIESNPEKVNDIFCLMTTIRLFRGIEFLHSHKLIHRDLKPSNILLSHDFIPFISDFETIRSIEVSSKDETPTPFSTEFASQIYASPEQFCGNIGSISYPTDIFSFGAIIYFIFEKKTHR